MKRKSLILSVLLIGVNSLYASGDSKPDSCTSMEVVIGTLGCIGTVGSLLCWWAHQLTLKAKIASQAAALSASINQHMRQNQTINTLQAVVGGERPLLDARPFSAPTGEVILRTQADQERILNSGGSHPFLHDLPSYEESDRLFQLERALPNTVHEGSEA